jgi:8-oxo-dGTP pyrophosphatase MutT (NUDIX family)
MNIKQLQKNLHIQSPSMFEEYDAAVLVPVLCDEQGNINSLLLTQRSAHLRSHAGQVAFAGGKVDEEDESIVITAQREAFEEIGLKSSDYSLLGFLDDIESKNSLKVCSVVVQMTHKPVLILNPDEVDTAFYFDANIWQAGPEYQLLNRTNTAGQKEFFQLPKFEYKTFDIWGMTAMILVQLLNVASETQWPVMKMQNDG